jgi:hypothetical protein
LGLGDNKIDPNPDCGTERWSVKTGTDADAHNVDLSNPLPASLARFFMWPRPSSFPPNNRIAPFEMRAYTIMGTLSQYKLESDEDYHLVVKDSGNRSMI